MDYHIPLHSNPMSKRCNLLYFVRLKLKPHTYSEAKPRFELLDAKSLTLLIVLCTAPVQLNKPFV